MLEETIELTHGHVCEPNGVGDYQIRCPVAGVLPGFISRVSRTLIGGTCDGCGKYIQVKNNGYSAPPTENTLMSSINPTTLSTLVSLFEKKEHARLAHEAAAKLADMPTAIANDTRQRVANDIAAALALNAWYDAKRAYEKAIQDAAAAPSAT